ncbi:pyruvate dehydrogenase (acetyl-transferring) E1 component subunit alpha [Alkalicoccobacillus gibsonii]|uniref:pyruvate dehydrogenase (acetyl-transferring) E1 component subunit alpha n=1 Tax=Alkalicoccobacillus gibsonii TaxID=79881 RepID=UPI0035185C9A
MERYVGIEEFKLNQVLDRTGEVTNSHLMPDLTKEQLITIMERMVYIRMFDERCVSLSKQGRLGFYAPVAGQEASMIGSQYVLEKDDWILPGYRDLPQILFHGVPMSQLFLWSKGHTLGGQMPDGVNVTPPQIIIGAQIVQAAGVGLGLKKKKKENIVVTYTGDGGSSQGDFYEGLNFAGAFKTPTIVFVQNNQYAISTPYEKQTAAETIAQKAVAVGIKGVRVDGMDVLATYAVTLEARKRAVSLNEPTLIEAVTYRYGPHSMSGDNPKLYRSEDSESEWIERDPLHRFRVFLQKQELWTDDQEEQVIEKAKEDIQTAIKEVEATKRPSINDLVENMFEK